MNNSAAKNIPYLDGWRGLAIIGVLVCHFGPRPLFSAWGNIGVQMFFVLSGYLMCNVLFIKKVNLKDFFAHRFSRIIPTFALFVISMNLYSEYWQEVKYHVPKAELLSTLVFLRTYFPTYSNIWSNQWPIGNVWSLNVEEHSYIFLALIATLFRASKVKSAISSALLITTITIITFCCVYQSHPPSGPSAWFLRTECAALGLVAAATIRNFCHTVKFRWSKEAHWSTPIIFTFAGCVGFAYATHGKGEYVIAPIALALAINYLHCAPDIVKKFLSARVLRWFGKCSFSIYLWQQPFFLEVSSNRLSSASGLAAALTVGSLSFYLFESPLRSYLNAKWLHRRNTMNAAQKSEVEPAHQG